MTEWPNLVLGHLPLHALWLNQIETVFSLIQRNGAHTDFASLQTIVDRLEAFEHHSNQPPGRSD